MERFQQKTTGGEKKSESVDDGDTAMTPAGTADGNGQIALPFAAVLGEEKIEKTLEPLQKLAAGRLGQDILAHGGIETGAGAQFGEEVRIGQETDIDHQIGGRGKAVTKTEGLQMDL